MYYKLIMFCEIIGKGKEVNKIVTNKKRKHTCVACACHNLPPLKV